MTLRLFLIMVLLCSALAIHAQVPVPEASGRNEIFTKLNSVATVALGNDAKQNFALGYRRYFKNFNLRAYAWQRGRPNTYIWQGDSYDPQDSTITSRLSGETSGYGLKVGIERMTSWPRKLNLYYGLDAGFGVMQENYMKSYSKISDTTYTSLQEDFSYIQPSISPYIGIRYDISPRFVASLELAPEISIARLQSEVTVIEGIQKEPHDYLNPDASVPTNFYTYSKDYGRLFSIETKPLSFWLAFRF